MIPVRVQGITADPGTNQFLMLLLDEKDNRILPIVIGQFEAQSIAWNLQGISMHRPLTHDLFKNFVETTDFEIAKILINNLKENTFYAKIILKNDSSQLDLDSRPSDAVAIALRAKAPIFVSDDVMKKAAVKINSDAQKGLDELVVLNDRLKKAIEEENYEEAAKIRDRINELEKKLY